MRAMGMRDRQIQGIVSMGIRWYWLVGKYIGTCIGSADKLANIVHRGIDYSALMRDNSFVYRVQGQLYGVWDPLAIIGAFFLGIALAVLVTSFSRIGFCAWI